MEFNDLDQSRLFLKMGDTDMVLPIGLDGSYRLSSEGSGSRGYWQDARTFNFEVFNIGVVSRQVQFTGTSLEVDIPEAGLTVACQMDNP